MPKKSKLKCPKCKSTDIEKDCIDCPKCGMGEVYLCNKCDFFFDQNGEEI